MELKLIKTGLLNHYRTQLPNGLQQWLNSLEDAELSTPQFSFYTSVSSVYSSKIEGESIELDSYVKHRREGFSFQPDYTKKIDDLYDAYMFAQHNRLTEANVKQVHSILSRHLVAEHCQGRYRHQNMYVTTDDGRIEYVAVPPGRVESEMELFFEDLEALILASLTIEEVFYFASMLHLLFVKIHPWSDGNGRSARLLEKWFLASKLGDKAWFIPSERFYYQHHQKYYNNIRALGIEYEELDYDKALPFLLMLPNSLKPMQ
jgi:Fic family protein